MDVPTAEKTANKVKAALAKRQGPAQKDQSATPIADAIEAYWERDTLGFSIPAHNGGRGPPPEFTRWLRHGAARGAVAMRHGGGTRNRAWQGQAACPGPVPAPPRAKEEAV